MAEPAHTTITQDRNFKLLFETYAKETVEFFVPEIVAARGRPVRMQSVAQHELPHYDLNEPSRFLDVALVATFADGSTVVLGEHWSDARHSDYDRVNFYVASLKLKHRTSVAPVIFVTDPEAGEIPDSLQMSECGRLIMVLNMKVVRVTADDLSSLRHLAVTSRVAAMMLALAYGPGVDSAFHTTMALKSAPGTLDEFRRLLPLVEKLTKLSDPEWESYRHRLKEAGMSRLEQIITDARAQGRIDTLLALVTKGLFPSDKASGEIEELGRTGVISIEQMKQALEDLNRPPASAG